MTEREKRVQWFQEARFGMFLHWGLYAIPGRGESWVTSAYENLAFVSFGTVPQYTYPLPDPIDTVLEIEYQ